MNASKSGAFHHKSVKKSKILAEPKAEPDEIGFHPIVLPDSPQFVQRSFESVFDVALLELLHAHHRQSPSDAQADDGAQRTRQTRAQRGPGDRGAEDDLVARRRRSGAVFGGTGGGGVAGVVVARGVHHRRLYGPLGFIYKL